MAIVADDQRAERCRYPGCGAVTRTGLLCPEHRDEAEQYNSELRGVSTMERIAIPELMVDTRFQRDPHEEQIQRIVLTFNEYDLGLLTVSQRDNGRAGPEGRYALLDGQQRWNALLRMHYQWAPCEVLNGLTLEQEIMIFCVRNENRMPIRRALLFNNKAKAGIQPFATAITILEQFGYKLEDVGPRSRTVARNRLSCPRTIEVVHRMGRLSPTLFAIRQAWPDSPEPNRAEVLMGIAAFLQLNQHIGADALADGLARFKPERLVENSINVTKGSIERRLWVHFYEQVVQAYNYQKQSQNRVAQVTVSPRAPKMWIP